MDDWFKNLTSRLRSYPGGEVWSCGDEILCRTESVANVIEDLISQLYASQNECVTICSGYYDPSVDKALGIESAHTGWWYVYID